ncbi:hypothetical protein L0Z14_16345 [Burkholderia multivorans]|uniref:hypothetical protein n=1 Tax=Burkholderia multivorans TaxID=87883 RepID=UPI00201A244E|nr:hypothetical protein [Burkholderia multivorans]MCL4662500.1 hypothetical protein [Burkholderia multivorans]
MTSYYGGLGIGYGLGLKIPKIRFPKFTTPEIKLPPIGGRDAAAAGAAYIRPVAVGLYDPRIPGQGAERERFSRRDRVSGRFLVGDHRVRRATSC